MRHVPGYFTLTVLICFLLVNSIVFAQEEEGGNVVIITTHKRIMPDDGSVAERDSLLAILTEIQKRNDKILSVKNLRHRWGHNFYDWVVIWEVKNWADVEAAGDMNEEIFEKMYPDKKYSELLQGLGKYFPTHSDEIYTELPKFGK
ncbi:MAG: hypothetical protein ACYSR9_01675 [Planctomycetota bacterium]|jgi:hypothetical protein